MFFVDMVLTFTTAYWDDGNIVVERQEGHHRFCYCIYYVSRFFRPQPYPFPLEQWPTQSMFIVVILGTINMGKQT